MSITRRCAAALLVLLPLVADAVPEAALDGLHWRLVGPFRGGWGVQAVGDPDQPDTVWFGAAGGGVWKTTDGGHTWNPIADRLPAPSIGSIALAASDKQVLYVGTGQVTTRYDIAAGQGVFRSADGGATWTAAGLKDTRHIGKLLIDPRSADTVLVAALGHAFGPNPERGVFRTTDGGKTWQRTLYVSDHTGAVDLAADPANPDVVFASTWQVHWEPWLNYFTPDVGLESAVYRSTDAGRTWTKLAGGGWPQGALGRIGLAAAHVGATTRVYAVIDAEGGNGGLWRSDDAGATWQHVNPDGELVNGYFAQVTVAPDDADVVYAMGRSIRRCAKGGAECVIVKGAPGGDDYHHLWINPKHPDHMTVSSDQGVVTTANGGVSWSSWYNQPTGQFYHLAADNRFPYRIYSGQQDSGTVGIASRSDYGSITFRDWHPVGADERDYDIPDPVDPDIVYGSGLGGRLTRWNAHTGEVQNIAPWPVASYGQRPTAFRYHYTWITPIAVSPLAPHPLYLGAQVLFRSTDRGAHWETISPDLSAKTRSGKDCEGNLSRPRARECGYGVIYSIGLSPRDNDEIWVGTDDGAVHLTRDGGAHWSRVTPKGLPSWAKVATVDVAAPPGTAYIAVDNHRTDDFSPRAYRTHDYGATWTPIADGLPAGHFVGVLRADPKAPGLLYAGTDVGVHVSFDDGAHWQPLQRNLPTAWVRDLLVHGDDLIAATQGRAIWVLDNVSPLRQISAGLDKVTLFTPADALRLRRNQNKDTPLPPEEPVGENPATGALIDYWLPHDAERVTLEFRDSTGSVVRRFDSAAPETAPKAERYFADFWTRSGGALSTRAGAHRFLWDLRKPRPKAESYGYGIGAIPGEDTEIVPIGMLVLPGDYAVVLSVDGTEYTTTLHVKPDPRATAQFDAQAALDADAFAEDVQAPLAAAADLSLQVHWLRDRIAADTKAHGDPKYAAAVRALAALDAVAKPLVSGEGDAGPNLGSIGDVLGTLETDLEGSDRTPTAPQRETLAATRVRLDAAQKSWKTLLERDLPACNAVLTKAGLTAIVVPPLAELETASPAESKDLP